MMTKIGTKIEDAFRSQLHQDETLHQVVFASEEPNVWVRRLLIGPLISQMLTTYYFVGLTNRRVLLLKSAHPGDEVKQIEIERIRDIKYQAGVLYGKIAIELSDNTSRNLTVDLTDFENAERFVQAFSEIVEPRN